MITKTENDSFKTFVGFSLIGHILLVAFFSVKLALFPDQDLMIQSAIRVDMVALPDKKQESAASAPTDVKKVEPLKMPDKPLEPPKPKTEPIKDSKNQQNKALERLKALSALDKLKEQVDKKAEPTPTKESEPYKGNIITKGADLGGLSKLQYDEYFAKLESHIKRNWFLPQWLADSDFRAQIKVAIDQRGYIIKKDFEKSSGNSVFDNLVIEALDRSSPCPVPPGNLSVLMENEGVIFNFP